MYNAIPGVNLPEEAIDKYLRFPIRVLSDDAALKAFLDLNDWVAKEFLKT